MDYFLAKQLSKGLTRGLVIHAYIAVVHGLQAVRYLSRLVPSPLHPLLRSCFLAVISLSLSVFVHKGNGETFEGITFTENVCRENSQALQHVRMSTKQMDHMPANTQRTLPVCPKNNEICDKILLS